LSFQKIIYNLMKLFAQAMGRRNELLLVETASEQQGA
jgi:hypothetical protein